MWHVWKKDDVPTRWAYVRERNNVENLGVNGRIALKCVFKKLDEDMELNDLAQDSVRWRYLVNVLMNLRFP